jgi:Ca2+:H+ antiporter
VPNRIAPPSTGSFSTLEIAIGSSTQIALFARRRSCSSACSWAPRGLRLQHVRSGCRGRSTVLVFMISVDGRSDWLEGAQLTGAYVIMAISFYFVEAL